MTRTSIRVAIVQSYLPAYRVALFDRLTRLGREAGFDIRVLAPLPSGSLAARNDTVGSRPSWHTATRGHSIRAGVTFHSYAPWSLIRTADIAVVPASATVVDTHLAVFGPRRRQRKVALWGHIDNFVQPANPVDQTLERFLMLHADHVFAYTQAGADFAIRQGVAAHAVSTLNNTIDTDDIRAELASLTPAQIAGFRDRTGLGHSRAFAVVGGLDREKRVDLLVATADALWQQDPSIKLIVGGDGDQAELLAAGEERGQILRLGYVGARTKAMLSATCDGLINLGRIGLIAVDALALRLPIITTSDFAWHAPEFAYLKPGKDLVVAEPDADEIARVLVDFHHPGVTSTHPQLDAMVETFLTGLTTMAEKLTVEAS